MNINCCEISKEECDQLDKKNSKAFTYLTMGCSLSNHRCFIDEYGQTYEFAIIKNIDVFDKNIDQINKRLTIANYFLNNL